MRRRLGPACGASCALHAALALLVLPVLRETGRVSRPTPSVVQPAHEPLIVWLPKPGQMGGGGGGGKEGTGPPRRVQLPGTDRITVPVAPPPPLEPPRRAVREPNPVESLVIPAANLASLADFVPGAFDAPDSPRTPQIGSGTRGGSGGGSGGGDGPGEGPGLGPGRRGGYGDGDGVGGGVTPPVEIRRGSPQYTVEAIHARVQGSVLVDCVVETSGVCGEVRIRRSPDPAFGLDDEALKAARQWRFRPGTRMGVPVPVRVTIEIAFTIR